MLYGGKLGYFMREDCARLARGFQAALDTDSEAIFQAESTSDDKLRALPWPRAKTCVRTRRASKGVHVENELKGVGPGLKRPSGLVVDSAMAVA